MTLDGAAYVYPQYRGNLVGYKGRPNKTDFLQFNTFNLLNLLPDYNLSVYLFFSICINLQILLTREL